MQDNVLIQQKGLNRTRASTRHQATCSHQRGDPLELRLRLGVEVEVEDLY